MWKNKGEKMMMISGGKHMALKTTPIPHASTVKMKVNTRWS